MSTDTQADAIKTFLAAATQAPVYDHDEAQKLKLASTLPATYTVIHLSRMFGGNVRGGTQDNDLRRLQTRVSAKTVKNARTLEDRIAAAFEHSWINLGDGVLAHFDYEAGGGLFELEEGYYTDLTDWTFSV